MDNVNKLLKNLVALASLANKLDLTAYELLKILKLCLTTITEWIENLESLNVDKAELKQQLEAYKRQLEKVKVYASGALSSVSAVSIR